MGRTRMFNFRLKTAHKNYSLSQINYPKFLTRNFLARQFCNIIIGILKTNYIFNKQSL